MRGYFRLGDLEWPPVLPFDLNVKMASQPREDQETEHTGQKKQLE